MFIRVINCKNPASSSVRDKLCCLLKSFSSVVLSATDIFSSGTCSEPFAEFACFSSQDTILRNKLCVIRKSTEMNIQLLYEHCCPENKTMVMVKSINKLLLLRYRFGKTVFCHQKQIQKQDGHNKSDIGTGILNVWSRQWRWWLTESCILYNIYWNMLKT